MQIGQLYDALGYEEEEVPNFEAHQEEEIKVTWMMVKAELESPCDSQTPWYCQNSLWVKKIS